jgi:hypothetical protein
MFFKKVFQLVKPFLANLHSTSSNIYSYMYSMTQKFFCSFVAYEYSKFAEFYTDFKSVEIIGKKTTQKMLFAKHFCKLPHCKSGSHKNGIRKSSKKTYNLIMGI